MKDNEPRVSRRSREEILTWTTCYSWTIRRPSPAERLRQRRKARAAVMRSLDRRDEVDLTLAYMVGRGDRQWPASRGTTTAQLVAMHLEAET